MNFCNMSKKTLEGFSPLFIADSTPESQKKGKSRFSLFSRSSN